MQNGRYFSHGVTAVTNKGIMKPLSEILLGSTDVRDAVIGGVDIEKDGCRISLYHDGEGDGVTAKFTLYKGGYSQRIGKNKSWIADWEATVGSFIELLGANE